MGSVQHERAALRPDAAITEKRMKRARTAAQLRDQPVMSRFRRTEWDTAFGASGTMRSVADTLAAARPPAGQITPRMESSGCSASA